MLSYRNFVLLPISALIILIGCQQPKTEETTSTAPATGKESEIDLKTLVAERKKQAMDEGKYECCLKHPCDQCLINMGMCPCEENLKAGKEVCHECKGGWMAGDGHVEGIKPEDVKVMPRTGPEMEHETEH